MKITKKLLEERAKLIHPDMVVFESDPRCGKLYAFGMMDKYHRPSHLSAYLPAKELIQWFDGFYNRDYYEKKLAQIVSYRTDD